MHKIARHLIMLLSCTRPVVTFPLPVSQSALNCVVGLIKTWPPAWQASRLYVIRISEKTMCTVIKWYTDIFHKEIVYHCVKIVIFIIIIVVVVIIIICKRCTNHSRLNAHLTIFSPVWVLNNFGTPYLDIWLQGDFKKYQIVACRYIDSSICL